MLHTPIFLMSAANIFHGWNGNTQLSRTLNIDDEMILFQINDLEMSSYAYPSHFRPGLYVASDTLETRFPDSQRVSLFCVTRPKRSLAGYQLWYVLKWGISSNVLPKNQIFPQNISRRKIKLKKRRITFIQPCIYLPLFLSLSSAHALPLSRLSHLIIKQ